MRAEASTMTRCVADASMPSSPRASSTMEYSPSAAKAPSRSRPSHRKDWLQSRKSKSARATTMPASDSMRRDPEPGAETEKEKTELPNEPGAEGLKRRRDTDAPETENAAFSSEKLIV